MFIVRYKTFFVALSLLFMIVSLGLVAARGLNLGVEFTGGTIAEVAYAARPDSETVRTALEKLELGAVTVQPAGSDALLIKMKSLSDDERRQVTGALEKLGTNFEARRFDSIGPVIGAELKRKSIIGITLVILLIMAYITFVFRKVSRPVASWKYGMIAIITLVHDVVIPAGFYAWYGHEVDILFVTAILAILGFSIHDTIVVFDRVRENLLHKPKSEKFEETVGKSLSETVTRSVNTSLTVVLALVALYLFGGSSTTLFALTLIIGIVAGTYSSVLFASPLLLFAERWTRTK